MRVTKGEVESNLHFFYTCVTDLTIGQKTFVFEKLMFVISAVPNGSHPSVARIDDMDL